MMSKKIQILLGIALLLAVCSCRQKKALPNDWTPPFSGADTNQVDIVLEGMTLDEKIGQLILWVPNMEDSLERNEVFQLSHEGMVGGLLLKNMPVSEFMYAVDSIRRNTRLPLFMASDQKVALHNQFSHLHDFPSPTSLASIDSTGLHQALEQQYLLQCKALGINLCLNPSIKLDKPAENQFDNQRFEQSEAALSERAARSFELFKANRILAVGDGFQHFEFIANDSLRQLALSFPRSLVKAGLGGLVIDDDLFRYDTLTQLEANYPKQYLRKYLNFKGLMISQAAGRESVRQKLLAGSDLMITPKVSIVFETVHQLLASNQISDDDIHQRARKVLLAKAWVHGGKLPVELSIVPQDTLTDRPVRFASISNKRKPVVVYPHLLRAANFEEKLDKTVCYFEDPRWGQFIGDLFENSVILARNNNEVLPFKQIAEKHFQIFKYSSRSFDEFDRLFAKYANFKLLEKPLPASGEIPAFSLAQASATPVAVILLDSIDLKAGFHKRFIESVNHESGNTQVVVLNFGNPMNLHFFDPKVACVQVFEKNKFTESFAAQLLFGGVTARGRLPMAVDESLDFGSSIQTKPVRLGFAPPEKVDIADEKLVGIDAIAQSAIDNGVFPGCQVAIAKDGMVIYSKSFGHFTYSETAKVVSMSDLYDIASVTKVAATTLAAMKLVEEQKLDVNGKVSDYLEVPVGSGVGNIKIKGLLLHQSGLQAQMPLSKFFSAKNVPSKGCNDYFCRKRKGIYNVKVADGLYFRRSFQDTIAKRVFNLPVSQNPRFRYSDVNFYLLKKVVESISKQPLDQYVAEQIYRPLGLRNIAFNPLERFQKSRIVPTEQDNVWRKTLVQGYVHDPSVALMGGVGGSAGIFSNAEDLAVLFHMLLEKGDYGGHHFFGANIVEDFITNKYTNHRGLGFDKPTKRRYPTYSPHASPKSFGHTGFTGTCVWVDPDQHLVYVFLSNRVNPSSRNGKIFTEGIRSRIHEVVYSAFGSSEQSLPILETDEEIIEVEEGAGG